MRRTDAALAVAVLVLSAAVGACGSRSSTPAAPGVSTATSSQGPGNALTVTDSQHRTFTLSPDRVTCGRPSQGSDSHGLRAVKVTYTEREPLRGVDIEVLPVEQPTTFKLPATAAVSNVGPLKAFVFVTAKVPAPRAPHEPPAFENSTLQELRGPGDRGRLTVLEASCHPARLKLTIHGRLGSEYSDPDVTVSGGVDLTER